MKRMSIGCIIAILLCLSVVAARGATDKALLFYFMFEEEQDGMELDTSDYGNNGIIKGNPELVEGIFGSALELDGTQDTIEIPHNDGLNITTAVTMEMWVRMKPDAGGNANQAGIEKGAWAAGEYSLYPLYNGGIIAQFNDLVCQKAQAPMRMSFWRLAAGQSRDSGALLTAYLDGTPRTGRVFKAVQAHRPVPVSPIADCRNAHAHGLRNRRQGFASIQFEQPQRSLVHTGG